MSYHQAVIYLAEVLRAVSWFCVGAMALQAVFLLAIALSWGHERICDRRAAKRLRAAYDREAHYRAQLERLRGDGP